MKIKIDLRPRELVERKKNGVNFALIIVTVIFLSFVAVSGTTFVYGYVTSRSLQAEVSRLNDDIAMLTAQNRRLSNEIARLSLQEKMYGNALALLREELPTLEFLEAVEKALPKGVWISSAAQKQGSAELKGFSYNENDIVVFARGLIDTGVVPNVAFPVTKRTKLNGTAVVDFSLSCSVGAIESIGKAGEKK